MQNIIKSISSYLSEVSLEFKKIAWPDRKELVDSTLVVLTFIVILAVMVLVCDKAIVLFLQMVHA